MPIFIASLLGGLISAAGSIAGRVLISLGIGYATMTGVSATLDAIKGQMQTATGSLTGQLAIVAGLLQIDVCMGIFLAAATAKLVLNGLTGGTIKKLVVK